jgi:TonB family protein
MLGRSCVVAALISLVAADPAPPSKSLQPISKWKLDYGYTQCTALRPYGGPNNPVTLGVVQALGGDTYELLIGRDQGHSAYPEELQGTVNFGSGPANAWLLRYTNASGKTIDQFRITSAQMAEARFAHSITFHIKGAADVTFALADMSALLDGMQKCTTDLQKFWNMGDKTRQIAAPPKGSLRAIFTEDDYPRSAWVRSQQGTAQYLLLIDEKGSVAGCHVVKPSGVPILDMMGCAVLQKRAKFSPARDAAGRPMRSAFETQPIVWRMPGAENVPTITL